MGLETSRPKNLLRAGIILVVTIAAASWIGAIDGGTPAAREASSWEHLALTHTGSEPAGGSETSGKIVALGSDGWELVSVETYVRDGTTTKTVFFFKRPQRQSAR